MKKYIKGNETARAVSRKFLFCFTSSNSFFNSYGGGNLSSDILIAVNDGGYSGFGFHFKKQTKVVTVENIAVINKI